LVPLLIEFNNSWFDIIVDVATIVTGLSAICAIIVSIITIRKNTKTIKAQNLIYIRDLFTEEKRVEIHAAIRNENTIENWVAVDDYLGIFELCFVLIDDGNLNLDSFRSQYGYRLGNILFCDEIIYYKLLLEYEFWDNFYKLVGLVYPNIKILTLFDFAIKIRDKYKWEEFIDIGNNAFVNELDNEDREEIKVILTEMRNEISSSHRKAR